MSAQNKAIESQPDKKNGRKPQPAVLPEQASEFAEAAPLPGGRLAANGDGNIASQVARLSDARFQTAQRRALAAQIGRVQGNQHLQRVIASLAGDGAGPQAAPDRKTIPSADPEVEPGVSRKTKDAGHPLDPGVKAQMDHAFGQNFSDVQIHTDAGAAELAQNTGASAVTLGRDIAFGQGKYQPGTPLGDALIAHELAHTIQQRDAVQGAMVMPKMDESGLEKDADSSITGIVASLWARARGAAVKTAQNTLPQLKSGLQLQRCSRPAATPTATINQVSFAGGLPMTAYGGDPKVNPAWTPGASDHAVAYTKGSAPLVSAQGTLSGLNLADAGVSSISVRVKEGGQVRGVKSGIAPSGGTVSVTDVPLVGLTGSNGVDAKRYTLEWEGSADGTTWTPIGTSGSHPIYWIFAAPQASPLYNLAVANATRYAAGATSAGAIGDAIRHGPRGVDGLAYSPSDPIDANPLDVYTNAVGICTDYGNLLSLLARSIGLNASALMFWGGFESLGKNVWAALGGGFINLINVRSPVPGFNPVGNPAGWAFNYHVIANIAGVQQDAALDRSGIEGQAVHDGKIVRLAEPGPGASSLPPANQGKVYSEQIPRKDHTVTLTIRDYGPRVDSSVFGTDIEVLHIPAGASSPVIVPVTWILDSGPLPPGLALDPATGIISGTPTGRGDFPLVIRIMAGSITNAFPVSIKVNKKTKP